MRAMFILKAEKRGNIFIRIDPFLDNILCTYVINILHIYVMFEKTTPAYNYLC